MDKTATQIESQSACRRRTAELVPGPGASAQIALPGRAVVQAAHRSLPSNRPHTLTRSVTLPDGG
jgi:hypothetical protein